MSLQSLIRIVCCVVAMTITSALSVAVNRTRQFPCELTALQSDIISEQIWDFSQQWQFDDNSRINVTVYGDSLLSESIDGHRLWYEINEDSIFYVGEEDRLMKVSSDSATYLCRLPIKPSEVNKTQFMAKGQGGGRKFEIYESGTIEFEAGSKQGRLILSQGDTITGIIVVRERRSFTATFQSDTIAPVLYTTIETYRWYDKSGLQSLLPVAIEQKVYRHSTPMFEISEGTEPIDARAFLPERNTVDMVNSDDLDTDRDTDLALIKEVFGKAKVSCDGRFVTVGYEMPVDGIIVTVDIMDAAGHLYFHEESGAASPNNSGYNEITVDCSALRTGEYIVAIGVKDVAVVPEKRIVIIR